MAHQVLGGLIQRHIGADGGQVFGEDYLLGVLLHPLLEGSLQLVGVGDEFVHAAELGHEFLSGLLPHAGTAGDVVHLVPHKGQYINHLFGLFDAVALAHLPGAAQFEVIAAVGGLVLQDGVGDQLAEVLVGGHHVGGESVGAGLGGHGADDVVGLEAGNLEDGDAVGADDILDDGDGEFDVLGGSLALTLVGLVGLVAEGGALRIEADRYVGGFLLAQEFLEGAHKAENGGCVHAGACHARHLD